MAKLTTEQLDFLRLIDRSMRGNAWATVSDTLWPLTKKIAAEIPNLIELDEENQQIRLTTAGEAIVTYV